MPVHGFLPWKPSIGSRLRVGSGKLSFKFAEIAVIALVPLAAVGTDGGAPAVHALAPAAVMLADARAPTIHERLVFIGTCSVTTAAIVPLAVMLTDARAPAILALAHAALMLADARAPAVFALAPFSPVSTQMLPPPQSTHLPAPVMRAFLLRPRHPGPALRLLLPRPGSSLLPTASPTPRHSRHLPRAFPCSHMPPPPPAPPPRPTLLPLARPASSH